MARSTKKSAATVPAWAWALGAVGVGGVAYLLLRRRPTSAATPPATGAGPTPGDAFGGFDVSGGSQPEALDGAPTPTDLAALGTYLYGGPTDTPLLGIDPATGRPATTPRAPRSPRRTSPPAPPPSSVPAPNATPTSPAEEAFAARVTALQTQLRRFTSVPRNENGTWSQATWHELVGVLGSHPNTLCGSPAPGGFFVPTTAEVQIWTDCLAQIP